MSLLQVSDVVVRLGPRTVLDGVSCSLAAGEILGVIGPNGAGKSTLLRIMAGLLRPDDGNVSLDGRELHRWRANARARRIGYLAQSAPVHWPLDVRTVVELGRLPWQQGWFGIDELASQAVRSAMEAAEVAELQERLVNELSGGERTRVMIARLLAGDPSILLADEPVAALDVYHQLHAMELLAERAMRGTGVVVVLHDLSLAGRFCDRILLLQHGRVMACDKARDVLQPSVLEPVYGVRMRVVEQDGMLAVIPWQRQ